MKDFSTYKFVEQPILILNDLGLIVYSNTSFKKELGWHTDAASARSFYDLFPEAVQKYVEKSLEQLSYQEKVSLRIPIYDRDHNVRSQYSILKKMTGDYVGHIYVELHFDLATYNRFSTDIEQVLDAAGVKVWERNIQTGEAYFDGLMFDILGYGVHEIKSHAESWNALVHPDDQLRIQQAILEHQAGQSSIYSEELRLKSKSGEWVWILDTGQIIEWDQNNEPLKAVGTHIDITSRVQLLNQIKEQKSQQESVIEPLSEGLMLFDVEGTIININQAALKILALDAEVLLNQSLFQNSWSEIAVDTDMNPINPENLPVAQVLSTKQAIHNYVVGHKKPDGSLIWIEINAEPIYDASGNELNAVVSTFTDITEQRKSQIELIKNQYHLEQASKIGGLGYYWIDQDDKLYWSDFTYELLNEKPQSFEPTVERFLEKYTHPEDKEALGKGFYQSILNQESSFERTHRLILDNGDIKYVNQHIHHYYNEDGKRSLTLGTVQDITNQMNQQESLRKAKIAAEQASKAKSEFLANMSHEIRTPLNGVIGFSDILAQSELDASQKQIADQVLKSSKSLMQIINDILDFSKIEAGKMELDPVDADLEQLLQECLDLINIQAINKGLNLVFDINRTTPTHVKVDPVRFKQVVTNLLSNAVKFTDSGDIKLSLGYYPLNAQMGVYRIEVADTGIGISSEKSQRIFEAFGQADSSTTRKYGGSGLGLVITNELLKLMESELELQSEEGVGSVFSFSLKLENKAMIEHQTNGFSTLKKALLVDDNATNRILLAKMLSEWGIEATLAADPYDAIKFVNEQKYDIVLMDADMPEMNGLKCIHAIESALQHQIQHPKYILLHCYSSTLQKQAKLEGIPIDAFIRKPIRQIELYHELGHLGVVSESSKKKAPTAPKTDLKQHKILIVEDVETNQLLLEHMIWDFMPNAKILIAANGKDAISLAIKHKPDLILMDIQMPEMDGYEATHEIRKLGDFFERLPIIASTARALKGERERCIEAGMNEFITKPINFKQLREMILASLEKVGI